jgi:phosphate transport system substrate-binding protein
MKKGTIKLIVSALMVGSVMVGCGGASTDSKVEKSELSTSITVSGSSALLPLMEKTIEKFNEENPDAEIGAQAGGSGTGLAQVLDGMVEIGNSDVFAEEKLDAEKSKELVDHKVVAQGFAIVVSKTLGIDNLTSDQAKDIFSGKVTNWKDVGGVDKEILLIHRTAGSGTRATFEKTVLGGDKSLENDSLGVTQDSNGAVLSSMKENDGAISYLGLAYMNSKEAQDVLTTLKIDGIASDKANITDGSYKFWSYGHMYTKGEATGLAKSFIEFVTSDDNRESVESLGFISGSEMKVE